MDRCEHDRLPKVGEACADDAAVLALSVTRFVAAGYMTGDVACWDAAYDGAERVLGEVEGPAGFLLVAPVSIKPLPRNSVWLLG